MSKALEAQKANLEKLKDQQTAQMQDMQAKQKKSRPC